MAVMDNTVLFTIVGSSDVRSVVNFPDNTKVEKFLSLKSLYPRGIHATSTRMFIGFTDTENPFPLTGVIRRGILMYDHKHTHIGTVELDPKNQNIFSLPEAITTNMNGDICVVDITSELSWGGRLVVLGEWGNLKWVYDGHPSINDTHAFTPYDVLTTPPGLVLVTDFNSNAVHVLSKEGRLLTSMNESHGIERPWSLNIDHDGKIQIGCDGGDDEAELFVFNLSV